MLSPCVASAALLCFGALVASACSSGPKTSSVTFDDAPTKWADLAFLVDAHLRRFSPADAVSLGHHEFDGMLPDRSPAALEQSIAQLEKDKAALLAADGMSEGQRFERDVLLQKVRATLFDLVELDRYRTNPMAYSGAINIDAYILRDYAPAFTRAKAVVKLCNGLPAYLAQARANLKLPIVRTWIDTALLQTKGLAEFADKDVRQQLSATAIPLANQAEIDPALDTCKAALLEHAKWLEQQQPQGTTAYALGEAKFLKMLAETQGVTADLATLSAIADADLQRNLLAIGEAARMIDTKRLVRDVVIEAAEDKPTAEGVIALATEQTTQMRQFVVDNEIVSIPSGEEAIVRESPPFQRWNSAFLNSPGAFEQTKLPAFYYISPPDPKWPAAEQRAYIPPRADLLFTTIHEVWPGHFLHKLHIWKHPSKVLKSYCTFSNSEGWAHYTEEMMYDAGVGKQTPQTRIGMLKEALLRNVRFVVAIGEHAKGMSVEDATKLFAEKGFVDPGNARQQAVRGTFDPMYLAYTLGKVMIRNLRADWTKRNPNGKLRDFHDQFLSYGCAPIPLIRRAMLGDDGGPPL